MTTVRQILGDPVRKHMRTDPTRVRADLTVAEAIDHIRAHPIGGRVVYFYVVDAGGKLVGVIPTRRLLQAQPDAAVTAVLPLLAGALTVTGMVVVMFLMEWRLALIAVGIALTAVFCYLVLRSSTRLAKFLGPSGISAMTGIMGFLLVCIGVQFVINGVMALVIGDPV